MFGLSLQRLCRISDFIIVRNLRNRGPPSKVIANPGLDQRIKAFKAEKIAIEDDDVEEFVESSDSDFSSAGITYNEHLFESFKGKDKLRHQIVRDKYFKENMPNLLTWSEKEQIRHLCTVHPDEWTPERVAESFPVTAAVVKKLLKYPWKPSTEARIARHDASALRNWKELKQNTLNISEELRQHFLKFANRTIPPLKRESLQIDITKEQEMGEFQKIIERFAQKEQKDQKSSEDHLHTDSNENNQTQFHRRDKKLTTLDELANNIKHSLDGGKEVDASDQMLADYVTNSKEMAKSDYVTSDIDLSSENNLVPYNPIQTDIELTRYPERIRIPKKAYKKGATYKVNDCYYDHDGRFLYRVIGMTKSIG